MQTECNGALQVEAEGVPATTHQPTCASAAKQDTAAAHEHTDPGQAQHESNDEGTAPSVNQGGHILGSLGAPTSARERDSPHCVDLPASPESYSPPTTGAAGAALQVSTEGEGHCVPRSDFPVMHDNSASADLLAFIFIWPNGSHVCQTQGPCLEHLLHANVCCCADDEQGEQQLTLEPLFSHTPPGHSSDVCTMHGAMSSGESSDAPIPVRCHIHTIIL